MFGKLLEPEIKELIQANDFASLREVFKEWSPADLAELIADLPVEEQVVLFRVLPHQIATETFEYLEFDAQEKLLRAMGQEETVKLINQMSPDDRTALLEELPSSAVTHLLKLLSPEERAVAQSLLGYPEHSIGRLMTPDFIAVREDWTVKQVFDFIREHGQDRETLNVVYVVDEKRKLIDDIRIREFLLRSFEAKVSEFRDRSFIALKVTDSETDAIELFRKYDRTAMPVVDSEGLLVGIVTIDDVLDVVEQETTAEIQKIGGMEALDEPYTTISLWRMVRKRATWLVLLFLGEMFTATAMQSYEGVIEKAAVLALFLPLIISSGGNSGSQATTLIIRAMAVGEVRLRDWLLVAGKELMAGSALGVILGIVGLSRITLWHYMNSVFPHVSFFTSYNPHWDLVAITVGVALVGVVLWGSLMGAMLPFILRRCGLDPATSSAPLVATLVDVTGLLIYFNVALLIMRGTLL
jgi:magnesium transporter